MGREDLTAMAEWLRSEGVEFCVLDVLNRLHGGEENSSDAMTRIMQRFDELARLASCQVCLIHHTNKSGGVKGSTAIEGWADWIACLEQSTDQEEVKTLFLRTKSSGAVIPRAIRYWQSQDQARKMSIVDPHLPPFLETLRIEHLRVAKSRVTLDFKREGERTYCNVVKVVSEPLEVTEDGELKSPPPRLRHAMQGTDVVARARLVCSGRNRDISSSTPTGDSVFNAAVPPIPLLQHKIDC